MTDLNEAFIIACNELEELMTFIQDEELVTPMQDEKVVTPMQDEELIELLLAQLPNHIKVMLETPEKERLHDFERINIVFSGVQPFVKMSSCWLSSRDIKTYQVNILESVKFIYKK